MAMRTARYNEAVHHLEQSLATSAVRFKCASLLTTAYRILGRHERSLPLLKRLLARRPGDPTSLRNLARAQLELMRYAAAADTTTRLLEVAQTPAHSALRAWALWSAGRAAEATLLWQSARASAPRDPTVVRVGRLLGALPASSGDRID